MGDTDALQPLENMPYIGKEIFSMLVEFVGSGRCARLDGLMSGDELQCKKLFMTVHGFGQKSADRAFQCAPVAGGAVRLCHRRRSARPRHLRAWRSRTVRPRLTILCRVRAWCLQGRLPLAERPARVARPHAGAGDRPQVLQRDLRPHPARRGAAHRAARVCPAVVTSCGVSNSGGECGA